MTGGEVYVLAAAVQPDGKMIIGGKFTTVDGAAHARIARLNTDGSVDATFTASTNGDVQSVAVQADGKIVLGGNFTTVNGTTRNRIARLHADGSLESVATFNPGTGVQDAVHCVAVQADGKIVIGGKFLGVNGTPRNYLARLNADGSLESTATFNPGTGPNSWVYCVAVQADGKIVLCGSFTTVNGTARSRIARLNADGSLESTATFNPGTGTTNSVYSVAVQADGKLVLGGNFTTVNGTARNNIARLHADGSLEGTATFNPGTGADDQVLSVALQADGKIVMSGHFTAVNGTLINRIARLSASGSLESTATFNPGTGASFLGFGVAVQADGKIVLVGNFTAFNGTARNKIARLANAPAPQTVSAPDATQVLWSRAGSAPEVSQVAFDLSTDGGTVWTPLGAGTRIGTTANWQFTGLSLPPGGQLRARGRTTSGLHNGSSGLVETVGVFTASPTPFQQWKYTHLGPTALDLGDPDGDGLATLAEYGINTLPQTPDAMPLPASRFTYPEGERLRLSLQRDPAHNDVTIIVEAAGSVTGPWTTVAVSTLGAPFSGPGYVGGDSATPGVKTVEIRDTVNITDAPARFLRVKVTR